MKSFNEFINERQQFLRSIGKNDRAIDVVRARDLKRGDWFWFCNKNYALRCQIITVEFEDDYMRLWFIDNKGERDYWDLIYKNKIDETTSMKEDLWIITTDEEAFLDFKEKYYPTLKIIECPAK